HYCPRVISLRAAILCVVVCAASLLTRPAQACSVCGCGDPLVSAGDARPFPGRVRVAVEAEYLTTDAASDDDPDVTETLTQTTLRPVLVYSPTSRLNLVLQTPLVRKEWAEGESSVDHVGVGDVDLGARWFVIERLDLASQSRQDLAVSVGT